MTSSHPLAFANLLYQTVFDGQWVEDSLSQVRPYARKSYARKLLDWVASKGKELECLLSEPELSASFKSLDNTSLGREEQQFLLTSQVQLLQGGSDRAETVRRLEAFVAELEQQYQTRNLQRWVQAILHWTNGHPDAIRVMCPLIVQADFSIQADRIAVEVEQMVRSQLLDNWENQAAATSFQALRDRLLRHEQCASLLQLYQKILQEDEIVNDRAGILTLVELGLVVQQQDQFSVASPIHKCILSLDWVEQALLTLPPYASKLARWLDTQKQDRSQLLRGEELQRALDWVSGNRLSDPANRFLIASQVFNLRGV